MTVVLEKDEGYTNFIKIVPKIQNTHSSPGNVLCQWRRTKEEMKIVTTVFPIPEIKVLEFPLSAALRNFF